MNRRELFKYIGGAAAVAVVPKEALLDDGIELRSIAHPMIKDTNWAPTVRSIVTGNHSSPLWPGLKEWFDEEYKSKPIYFTELFKDDKTS